MSRHGFLVVVTQLLDAIANRRPPAPAAGQLDMAKSKRAAPTWMPKILEWVCGELWRRPTKFTLEALAAADRGEDFDENLAAIRSIVGGNHAPLQPLRYPLREVCELFRWSQLDDGDVLGHLTRLFATLVILIADASPIPGHRGPTEVDSNSLIAAVDSVLKAFPERTSDMLLLLDEVAADEAATSAESVFVDLARFVLQAEGADAATLLATLEHARVAAEAFRAADSNRFELGAGDARRYAWLFSINDMSQRDEMWAANLDLARARVRARQMIDVVAALDELATRST